MTPRRIQWFLSLQDVLLTTTAHIAEYGNFFPNISQEFRISFEIPGIVLRDMVFFLQGYVKNTNNTAIFQFFLFFSFSFPGAPHKKPCQVIQSQKFPIWCQIFTPVTTLFPSFHWFFSIYRVRRVCTVDSLNWKNQILNTAPESHSRHCWRRDQVRGRCHEDANTLDLSEVRTTRLVLNANLSHTLSSV